MQRHRTSGQTMVIAAMSIAVLLSMTAVAINVGLLLIERRHLQNAADAAALAGLSRLAEEQSSRSFRDSRVMSSLTTISTQNNVDGSRQLTGTYYDQAGTALGSVGAGGQFAEAAAAVDVQFSGQLSTVLAGMLGQSSSRVDARGRAGLASVAFPSSATSLVPLGVPLAAFQAGASYDLYDQSVALASYGVSGYRPFLQLAFAGNSGTSYIAATDYGSLSTDMQYWSDGLHSSGQLGTGNTIAVASGSYVNQVRAGLLDNVRRQGLVDGGGASYALIDVPIWNQYQVGGLGGQDDVTIVGFARFKIAQADITSTSLRGYFVPYILTNSPAGTAAGVRWGPSHVTVLR